MKWQYKGKTYTSIRVKWGKFYVGKVGEEWNEYLGFKRGTGREDLKDVTPNWILHVPKWHNCYKPLSIGLFGHSIGLTIRLMDIYSGKICYTQAKNCRLVVEYKPSIENGNAE